VTPRNEHRFACHAIREEIGEGGCGVLQGVGCRFLGVHAARLHQCEQLADQAALGIWIAHHPCAPVGNDRWKPRIDDHDKRDRIGLQGIDVTHETGVDPSRPARLRRRASR
jgi:hypothetical protein